MRTAQIGPDLRLDTNRIRVDGRIRFVYATCGRRYFCIRKKKFAGTKISGYVWTGPKTQDFQNHTLFSREAVPRGYRSLVYQGLIKLLFLYSSEDTVFNIQQHF